MILFYIFRYIPDKFILCCHGLVDEHITHLETPLRLDMFKGVGILKTAPMTINNIPDDDYKIIKAHGGINGRFTVN